MIQITDEMVAAAQVAFEPMSSILRYRGMAGNGESNWHGCDILALRDALKAAAPFFEGQAASREAELLARIKTLEEDLQISTDIIEKDCYVGSSRQKANLARIAKLESALMPFATIAIVRDVAPYNTRADNLSSFSGLASPTEGHFRAAREALEPKP